MTQESDFLERLLNAPGPSGFEVRAARVWRQRAERFADRRVDRRDRNSFASVNPGGRPRVMMAGHIDEIGLQITHIDKEGFLYFDTIGGWERAGARGPAGAHPGRRREVPGVVGKKPIHLMKASDRAKASKVRNLWIDVGAGTGTPPGRWGCAWETRRLWTRRWCGSPGTASPRAPSTTASAPTWCWRRCAGSPNPRARRARWPSPRCRRRSVIPEAEPAPAPTPWIRMWPLVVDVTFSTDAPTINKKELGEHKLGGGPVLSRGSAAHPVVFDRLARVAEAEGIAYSIQAAPRATPHRRRRHPPSAHRRPDRAGLGSQSLHALAQRGRQHERPGCRREPAGGLRARFGRERGLHAAVGERGRSARARVTRHWIPARSPSPPRPP